jgi:adenylate cyclase
MLLAGGPNDDNKEGNSLTSPQSDESAPTRATVVVLYAETRGFTRMSEILEPGVVLARIGEFFTLVTAAIERHEGTVRSLLNDNLIATFAGAAEAQHAVEAAQEIQRDFGALAEAWQRDYGFNTAVAIGLHSGDAVVGVVDGQSLIIGDGLSIAERLLHGARPGEFVLSKPIMDALIAAGVKLEAEELPALTLSKRDSIPLYGVQLDDQLDFTD